MDKTGLLRKKYTYILILGIILFLIPISCSFLLAENEEESEKDKYFNTSPTITHLSNNKIEVSWKNYPESDESTHYQVMLDHVYYGHSTKGLKQVCDKMIPGSKLQVRVATFHKGDFCGISTYSEILMLPEPPEFSVYDVATASFCIVWSGTESSKSYNVYNNDEKIASKEESGTNNKLSLDGFEQGSILNITMTSVNETGESPKSQPKVVQLYPIASLTMTIPNSSITSTSFKVKWKKQPFATGYKILVNDESAGIAGADDTEFEVTGLTAGTTVSVKIAIMSNGGEAASGDSIIVQLKPDAPVLTATDISSYSCTLTWSVANGANNYKVFENGDNAIFNVPSTITNITITENVIPGATYYYKVRGVNDIGESEDSNIVEVTYLPGGVPPEETSSGSAPLSPVIPNRLLSSSFNIPEAHFSDALKQKSVVAVYFPKQLKGAELALEEEYLEMLAETPEMANVRFYGIFTDEIIKRNKNPENIKFLKAKASDKVVIPGKIPVVRFYAEGGVLRKEILISIPIMTVTDVYKALPEVMEKRSKVTNLYHE